MDTPSAIRTVVIRNEEVNSVGDSDDGRYALLRRWNRCQHDTFTPEDDYHIDTNICKIHFTEVGPTSFVNLYTTPLWRNTRNCYDEAVFAP